MFYSQQEPILTPEYSKVKSQFIDSVRRALHFAVRTVAFHAPGRVLLKSPAETQSAVVLFA